MSVLRKVDGYFVATINLKDNLNRLHDVILEIDDISRPEDELIDIFNSLSEKTKFIAYQWGLDTEFGDAVYTELKEKAAANKVIEFLRRHSPNELAKQFLSVQPMSGVIFNNAKSEKQLREEGYEPIDPQTNLMWTKKVVDNGSEKD